MARIIAGRFETSRQADEALADLRAAGVQESRCTTFFVNPAGRHGEYPIGGDAQHDEGTGEAGGGAAKGAAIGGAAGGALGVAAAVATDTGLAAAAAIGGAGVGAYLGSVAGALSGMRHGDPSESTPDEPVERRVGAMVAVAVRDGHEESAVVDILRRQGAHDIEEADGDLRDGSWVDFDATRPVHLISGT